jgi:hypothetical protein
MTIPQPPDHLHHWPGACEAWHRIIAKLQARGEWLDLYVPMSALTALQCALYLKISEYPEFAEDTRRLARAMLAEMHYLPRERAELTLLDAHGRDAEILAVCGPLPSPLRM